MMKYFIYLTIAFLTNDVLSQSKPESFISEDSVFSLILTENRVENFKHIDSILSNQKSILKYTEIWVRTNSINYIPENFYKFIWLTSIEIEPEIQNQEFNDTLPFEFNVFNKLEHLWIYQLPIISIDERIKLPLLKSLFIDRTKLCHLPSNLISGDSLRMISLMGNNLQKFPKSIKKATNLKILEIECSYLEEIPKWIGKSKSLTKLRIKTDSISCPLNDKLCENTHLTQLVFEREYTDRKFEEKYLPSCCNKFDVYWRRDTISGEWKNEGSIW